jgi:FkbM family methyltransferase
MKELAKQAVLRSLWALLGRRNLVRFARMLALEARYEAGNAIESNGERLVQALALAAAPPQPAPVFLDVGANLGQWARSLLDQAAAAGRGELRLHCFEPCRATHEALGRNLAAHALAAHVATHRLALSNRAGTALLNVVGEGAGTNSLHEQPDVPRARQEPVELGTLDAFCREQGIERVALLKIDAEGHDLPVLEGGRDLFARRAIDLAQFEYSARWIHARHFLKDAFELLAPLGYRLGKITPRGIEFYAEWHFELESFREANYLACRADWAQRFPQIPWWNAQRAAG